MLRNTHHDAHRSGGTVVSVRVLRDEIDVVPGLRLRRPKRSDTDALIAACQDPEISRWTRTPSPYGAVEADSFFALAQQRCDDGDEARTFVLADADDVLLGCVGFPRVQPAEARAELGYWLAPNARGHGHLTAAIRPLLREALLLGYERIEAEVLVGNDASCRVLERVGFTHEGVLRSLAADGIGMGSARIDVHIYSVIRADPIATSLLS